jgi:hypothetical protein
MDSDAPCANATFLFPEQRPLSFVWHFAFSQTASSGTRSRVSFN